MRFRLFGNRGDTIIEVMIALAVLGSIIAGGYAIATKSLNGVRVAQERSEALKIAEGQIETLKYRFAIADNFQELTNYDTGLIDNFKDHFTQPSYAMPIGLDVSDPALPKIGFCFYDDTADVDSDMRVDELIRFNKPGDNLDNFSSYPSECVKQNLYHVYITNTLAQNCPTNPDVSLTYKVNVTWNRSGGGEVQHLYLEDRVNVDFGAPCP